jgi:hypothetical protein
MRWGTISTLNFVMVQTSSQANESATRQLMQVGTNRDPVVYGYVLPIIYRLTSSEHRVVRRNRWATLTDQARVAHPSRPSHQVMTLD